MVGAAPQTERVEIDEGGGKLRPRNQGPSRHQEDDFFGVRFLPLYRGAVDFQRSNQSWRKVEEPKTVRDDFQLKPLKYLALPRGIEPLFQP